SAPVLKDGVQQALRWTPAFPGAGTDHDPWENVANASGLARPHQRGQTYELPLPDLQWGTTYRLQAAPREIKDAFGRKLAEAIDVQFTTEHKPPEFVLRHPISVLEQHVETHVPLEVLNLQEVHLYYETLTAQGLQTAKEHTIPLNTDTDTAYLIPLKLRE